MSVVDPDSGETVPDGASQPFPNPGEVALDLAAESAGQVPSVYQKPKLLATVAGHAALAQRIEDCLVSIPPLDDPAIATAVNLDVTGELVGQSRVLSDGTVAPDGTTSPLTDFRLYIAMRILRNAAIGSSPEYVAAVTKIFGSTPFRYYDLGGMAVGIEVGTGASPSSDIIALLNDGPVPRAMSVGVGREWYDPADWFGFAEDTGSGAKGFGLESDPTVGGQLAMLF